MKLPAVYIMTNKPNGTLYVGVTSDLVGLVWQHKEHVADGFTKKYDLTKLVYFEQHQTMESAILREKQLKQWNRDWKIRLIQQQNIEWFDLYETIL
jgi:putative endonuclease